MKGEERRRRIEELHDLIQKCQERQERMREDILRLRRTAPNAELAIKAYLGERSYDEWMISYDRFITESNDEIEALTYHLEGLEEGKGMLLLAGAISAVFFLLLMVFFLPTPISVLTGNVVGVAESDGAPTSVYIASLILSFFVGAVSYVVLIGDR